MSFMSMRELRSSTSKLDEVIAKDGRAVITNNGKPAYIMIGVDEDTFESTLIGIRQAEARAATDRIRARAQKSGLNELSEEDIQAEIDSVRRTHKR